MTTATASPPRQFLGGFTAKCASAEERLAFWKAEFERASGPFRGAFEHAAIGNALVDLDGRWLKVNRRLCEIVGYDERELLATDFQSITHPDDLDADIDLARRLLDGKIDHYHMEKRYRHRQGHCIGVLLSVSLVRDEQGRPCYFVSQIQDISDRKQAEARIDQTSVSNAHTAAIIVRFAAASAILIGLAVIAGWIFDIETLKTLLPGLASMKVNSAVSFVLAGSSLAMSTRASQKRWRLATTAAAMGVAMIGGLTLIECAFNWQLGIDEILLSGDDSSGPNLYPGRPAVATAACLLALGVALALLPYAGSFVRRSVQFLALSTALVALLALVGHLYGADSLYSIAPFSAMALHTAAILMLLAAGVLHARPDFEIMLPLTSLSLGGTAARRLLPAMVAVILIAGWLRVKGEQHRLFGLEFGVALYGVTLIVVFSVLVWRVACTMNTADDRRRQAEARQLKDRAELAHVLRLNTMGEMAAGIAHELNQPLSAITNFARGAVRRLRNGRGNQAELLEVTSQIAQQSSRASEIVRSLRRYVERCAPQYAQIGVNTLVHESSAIVAGEAHDRSVSLTLDCQSGLPQVRGDRIQLQQVIVNLLCNAFDATEGNSQQRRVTLNTRRHSTGGVEVTVADNGYGLPAEGHDRIFEAFFTTKPHGLGMGLSISRSIIEAHGGRLWAESSVGGGVEFHFVLPTEHEMCDAE